jgi:hypothetical protein
LKKILAFASKKIKKINLAWWPELSKQCYNLSCTMCQMNFLSNILTWLILPGPPSESNYLPIYYYEIKNVCFLSHSCLLGQINFKYIWNKVVFIFNIKKTLMF